jgi:hypothetical protein
MYQQTLHQHDANPAEIDIHKECWNQCRSSIILTYIDQHPESLAIASEHRWLPLHILLSNTSSSIDIALMMSEKYPAALQHRDNFGDLPLHMECYTHCRSSIISRCIELYPEALAIADGQGILPLHSLLLSKSSSVEDALLMIEKYPAALQHRDYNGYLPLHMECDERCRSTIISKCIELFPEGLAVASKREDISLCICCYRRICQRSMVRLRLSRDIQLHCNIEISMAISHFISNARINADHPS